MFNKKQVKEIVPLETLLLTLVTVGVLMVFLGLMMGFISLPFLR